MYNNRVIVAMAAGELSAWRAWIASNLDSTGTWCAPIPGISGYFWCAFSATEEQMKLLANYLSQKTKITYVDSDELATRKWISDNLSAIKSKSLYVNAHGKDSPWPEPQSEANKVR